VTTTVEPQATPEGTGLPRFVAALPAVTTIAVLATIVGVLSTGAAAPLALGDPGPVVRWGIPVVKVLLDLFCAVTIGVLALACVALPTTDGARSGTGRSVHAHRPALIWASAAAAGWALCAVLLAVFGYADVAGTSMSDPGFGTQLWVYLTGVDLGIGQFVVIVVAALVSVLAAGAQTMRAAGLLLSLSLVGLIPPALAGHASGAGHHETAVTGLGLHLLGMALWVGGLLGLALLWPYLRSSSAGALAAQRFSPMALWSFVAIAFSGVVSAWIRLGDLGGLGTAYGRLVLAKTGLLIALGVAGWWHRRRTLTDLHDGRDGAFLRLVLGELAVMAVATGFAAALARSAPPVPDVPPPLPSLAQSLTGYPMPDPPSLQRWLFSWQPDLLWITVAALAGGLYLRGVVRIHRRGDHWPWWRVLLWFAGLAALLWLTCGGPMVYGRVLFSAHMLGHMMLSMLVPLLLVMAAPLTLALRTLPARHDGTRGPREWVLAVLDSWYSRQMTRPAVSGFLFAGTLYLFYFSGLFPLALRTHIGHEVMHLHFLAAGYLFLWVLIGPDPGPHRPSPALRMMFMFAVITFHTFFGVALMMSRSVLAEDFYSALQRPWSTDLVADQHLGGGVAWGLGELPMVAVALILAVQWARADDREARRQDRAADRDHDAELGAYNAMLAEMARRDERIG